MFNRSLSTLVGLASCVSEEDQVFLLCDLTSYLLFPVQCCPLLCCPLHGLWAETGPAPGSHVPDGELPAFGGGGVEGKAVGMEGTFFPSPKIPQQGLFLGGEGRIFGCDQFSTPLALGGDRDGAFPRL